ncbi:hypothetical protein F4860DRAFT_526284 [Xylaria cubensis]|nr:hypothetical protein F4860DRAFT_526284 [Xylaria cubensis]
MDRLPSQDPDRPPLPYMPGLVVQITEHSPPPPFGGRYYAPSKYLYLPEDRLKDTLPTQQVLMCSPQDGKWPSDTTPRSGVLTITKLMSVGEARGAQIVVCNVLIRGETEPYTAVAKIYDPLYYPFYERSTDLVWGADLDYSREADAYRHLQTTKALQKSGFAPEYYGSWTFDLTLTLQNEVHKRPVRLLLIEHIDGSSILDLFAKNSAHLEAAPDAFHFDEAYRLDVLAEMLEGVLKQLHSGLDQRDFAPRNIMLVPSPREAVPPLSVPRVVLVDYNIARVFEHTTEGRHPHQERSLPTNPVQYFRYPPWEFQQWVPFRWYHKDPRSYEEWLLTRFGGKHADRFAPIENVLEFSTNSSSDNDENGGHEANIGGLVQAASYF